MIKFSKDNFISGSEKRLEIIFVSEGKRPAKPVFRPKILHYLSDGKPFRNSLLILTPEDLWDIKQKNPTVERFQEYLRHVVDTNNSLIFFSGPHEAHPDWVKDYGISYCVSELDAHLLESRLTGLIREIWDGIQMRHASLIQVNGTGILLIGESGAGKTHCALEIASRGHNWIADDIVVLHKHSNIRLQGFAHHSIRGLVHLRGKGIQHVSLYVNNTSIIEYSPVDLVIELEGPGHKRTLEGTMQSMLEIMGIKVPYAKLIYQDHQSKMVPHIMEIIHSHGSKGGLG
jgi:serine kinase of HPr protein (carbohydrate metabolism regulator)